MGEVVPAVLVPAELRRNQPVARFSTNTRILVIRSADLMLGTAVKWRYVDGFGTQDAT